jgi:membrane associated rhomboid family serine protease
MASAAHDFMLQLLQACAERAPEPLYPASFAKERNLDRDQLDAGLDELRRRGLIKLTDWVKEFGQGRTLTEAGWTALSTKNLAPVTQEARSATVAPASSTYARGESVRNALYEPQPPWMCWILIAANVLYFLYGAVYAWENNLPVAEYLAGNDGAQRTTTHVLVELGGLFRGAVLPDPNPFVQFRPEFERILLACFLHVGVLHLAMNMYFLGSLGGLVESMWGKVRFLVIYLIAGLVSGCIVLCIDILRQRNGLTVGASGCLYGLFASMAVWIAMNRRHLPEEFLQSWSRTLGINLFLMFTMNLLPGVSWQAHFGGAIGGALAAVLLQVQRFHPNAAVRLLALFGLPIIPLTFFLLTLWQAGWI